MQEISTDALNWVTVGRGQAKPSCGDIRSVFGDCSRTWGHDVERIKLGCNTWDCPACCYRRAWREARDVVHRLHGCQAAGRKHGVDLGEIRHLVMSSGDPREPATLEPYQELTSYRKIRAQAIDYAQIIGMIGGTAIIHAVRGPPAHIRAFQAHQKELPFSPHFHLVGFMPEGFQVASPAFYEATGWIYKNMPIYSKGGEFELTKYELGHAARFASLSGHISQAYTWWGCSSYNQVEVKTRTEKTVKACRVCRSDKHKYTEDYAMDLGELVKVKKRRVFTLSAAQLARLLTRYKVPPEAWEKFRPSDQDQEQGVI